MDRRVHRALDGELAESALSHGLSHGRPGEARVTGKTAGSIGGRRVTRGGPPFVHHMRATAGVATAAVPAPAAAGDRTT
jgi:hypothetical protein